MTKSVILCGGLGTRIAEESIIKPKPMVEIDNHPILWHVMNSYYQFGFKDFYLALGYKGEVIKEYFKDYSLKYSDFSVNLKTGEKKIYESCDLDWKINLIDTGSQSMTGGRLLRLKPYLQNDEFFFMTYGDGLSNIDIGALLRFHKKHKKHATVTAVRPPARFGNMNIDDNQVLSFEEKPQIGEGWINGGFFVLNKQIFDYIDNDLSVFEKDPLENLAKDNQLMAYKHEGFWQCMDTVRDRDYLRKLAANDNMLWLKKK